MWAPTKQSSPPAVPPPDLPSASEAAAEAGFLFNLSGPIALTAILLYSRSALSMSFLGSLGDLPLAAGSLAVAFANITGYSILSGLSLGMEPLCSQSHGAAQPKLLLLTLYRSVLFLLACSIPISLLWAFAMPQLLLTVGQDPDIVSSAHTYLLFCLPDLVAFSFIHPIRIYLRSQGITRPLTLAASLAALLHLPLNYLLVKKLSFGIAGVAAASAVSNLALLLLLLAHLGDHAAVLQPPPLAECIQGWGPLARLALPSCASVCLEWWWYELMILSCGFLPNPKPAIASMGVLIQTTALLYIFPSSLGFGASARVGNELGANRPPRARTSALVSVSLAGLMGFLAMGFAAGVKDHWGRMFTRDAEILRLTAAALPIVGLCELGNCPQTVGCGVLRGSARPKNAARINLGAFYFVGLPVGACLGFGLGLGFCGLWAGLLAAQVCCAGAMLYAVGTTDWGTQAQRAKELTRAGEGGHVTAAAPDDDLEAGKGLASKGDVEMESKCCEPLISIKMASDEIER